jgi:hypothetical protein
MNFQLRHKTSPLNPIPVGSPFPPILLPVVHLSSVIIHFPVASCSQGVRCCDIFRPAGPRHHSCVRRGWILQDATTGREDNQTSPKQMIRPTYLYLLIWQDLNNTPPDQVIRLSTWCNCQTSAIITKYGQKHESYSDRQTFTALLYFKAINKILTQKNVNRAVYSHEFNGRQAQLFDTLEYDCKSDDAYNKSLSAPIPYKNPVTMITGYIRTKVHVFGLYLTWVSQCKNCGEAASRLSIFHQQNYWLYFEQIWC